MVSSTLLAATFLGFAAAQMPGKSSDVHPKITTWKCTNARGCKPQNTALVLDSSSNRIHQRKNTSMGCGNWGSRPDPKVCPDEVTCMKNCVIEGIQKYADYGVTTSGESLQLDLFNQTGGLVSPRVYLLAEDTKKYEMLRLTGYELSFDVDVSKLPCGMNGALYLSEMDAEGGRSALNPGGASYGTGYCDSTCAVTPWINGIGNIAGEGACCHEMDIWEANSRATQITSHTCSKDRLFRCTGHQCTATRGLCDMAGCSDNPYRDRGAKNFYGLGLKVDTSKPFTVVTQFPAKKGVLQAIVRKYVQNGTVIENAATNITMNQAYCSAQAGAERYIQLGGHKNIGEALARGMVLAMSVWWDGSAFMNWLDAGAAGPCNATQGNPKVILTVEKAPVVKFSQIKWGEIGSTFGATHHSRA